MNFTVEDLKQIEDIIRKVLREECEQKDDELLDRKGLAALLHISISQTYRITNENGFPRLKARGKLLFPRATVLEYLERINAD